jgi:ADP-heptose:LPS heptosyltransferase
MDLRTQRRVDNYVGRIGIALLRPPAQMLGALLRRDHELSVGNEIVWIKMLGGGSLLLAMPMLLGFRHAYPNLKMVLVTTRAVKPFAELLGVFDEYRVIDERGAVPLLTSSFGVWTKTLRADCIVDLEVHSRLTTVFTTLTMARNRVSFWLEDIFWRRGLASHLVFFNRSSGSYHFYDRVGDLFGVGAASREQCRAALVSACGITIPAAPDRTQVAIGFACSDLGQERMLNPAQWVRVFRDNIKPHHHTFNVLGGSGDRATGQKIIEVLRATFPTLCFRNACGELTLGQSVQTLFDSGEFWGIDSSLLHLARIAGSRCVSYWGPTDPATRLRDTWELDETTHYRKIACSPCVHTSEEPPCRGDNRCIQGLFADHASAPVGWTPIEYPPRRRAPVTT